MLTPMKSHPDSYNEKGATYSVLHKMTEFLRTIKRYEKPPVCQRIEEEPRQAGCNWMAVTPHQLHRPRSTWCSITYHRTHRQAIEYVEAMKVLGYFAWTRPC